MRYWPVLLLLGGIGCASPLAPEPVPTVHLVPNKQPTPAEVWMTPRCGVWWFNPPCAGVTPEP